jgi:hypothetical protein
MCLHAIAKKKPEPEGEGWKVFRIIKYFTFVASGELELGSVYHSIRLSSTEWNKTSVEGKIYIGGIEFYHTGFHIFTDLAAAKRMAIADYDRVILKVRYRGAHTIGQQWVESKGWESVVAEEFQIIESQKISLTEVHGV